MGSCTVRLLFWSQGYTGYPLYYIRGYRTIKFVGRYDELKGLCRSYSSVIGIDSVNAQV